MNRPQRTTVLLTVLMMGLTTAVGWAAPGQSLRALPQFKEWLESYEVENGDRHVLLPLQASRFFTEDNDIHGFVELDLIGGGVTIELENLDRDVDVWVLDNAVHTSILPGDPGDNLIHLARLAPAEGAVVRFERDLGAEAFRGFQLDWIFVSEAGVDPAESRLLVSTQSSFEREFTRQRLAGEGFDVSIPPRRRPLGTKAIAEAIGGGVGIADTPHQILVTKGLVTQEQFDGADVFFREIFDGNGRSCGTCHPAENNQTIDGPDFIESLPPTDPLFVAEQVPPGHPIEKLEVPTLMRQFHLIVENVDGPENPTVKFVLRGVPHSLSLATSTTPDDGIRTGWSGDGAPPPGTLRFFLLGAIMQHYPKESLKRVPGEDFRLPSDEELDVTLEFMLGVGRLNDVNLGGVVLNNDEADSGRVAFIGSLCNNCHLNAGATASFAPGQNLNLLTEVEKVPNPAAEVEPMPLDAPEYPLDGGFGKAKLPNRDCDDDGDLDCFGDGTFNTAPLIEAADTDPLFHNNVALTIEDAVRFYTDDPFPAPIPFDEPTVQNVAAFLRVINASFNLQIAIQRCNAALILTPGQRLESPNGPPEEGNDGVKATANKILDLANDENEDALRVLTDGPKGDLDPTATAAIRRAVSLIDQTIATSSNDQRRSLMFSALIELSSAKSSLGSGMDFQMGTANLLF